MDKLDKFHKFSSDRTKLSSLIKVDVIETYEEKFIVLGGKKTEPIKYQLITIECPLEESI